MKRGYTRLRLQGCGAGASERLAAVLREFDRRDGGPRRVGEIRQVFDRSAYLAFDRDLLGAPDPPGPPLVLLAGAGFDGPLSMPLVGDDPAGFDPQGLAPGDQSRLRTAARRRGPGAYVLAVGDAMDIELDANGLGPVGEATGPVFELSTMAEGSDTHRRATEIVELFEEHEVTDGLGWLAELRRLASGDRPTGDLRALIDWWSIILDGGSPSTEPPSTILGRGPGATPSGDDVVAGLLLALNRSTDGARRDRIRSAGDELVELAEGRTTDVSAALLAQAVRGRAAGRIESAIGAVLVADDGDADWPETVLAATEVGHTSGVDHLIGALIVPLGLGPRTASGP